MEDPRLYRLAKVLVDYSTEVRAGDLVRIAGSFITRPLMAAVYRAVLEAGGHPIPEVTFEDAGWLLLEHGTEDQLRFEDPVQLYTIERVDVSIGLLGSENTKALSPYDPKKQALLTQAAKRRLNRLMERAAQGQLRWVVTQFPCPAAAQDAYMSLSAYERFVFRAGMLHLEDPVAFWRGLSEQQERLVDFLSKVKELRFVTPQGTDLRLNVEGRRWISCSGKNNFPDGEVFTGPVEDATEGMVVVSFPAVYQGREVDGIRLRFRAGRVIEASAAREEAFLISMLDQDQGARVVGEIAFGTNYGITHYTRNTLFDEKIGGTFHFALGAAYPETGGKNVSGLHWDLVVDLRKGGEVYADGRLILRDGRFLDPSWPQPTDGWPT